MAYTTACASEWMAASHNLACATEQTSISQGIQQFVPAALLLCCIVLLAYLSLYADGSCVSMMLRSWSGSASHSGRSIWCAAGNCVAMEAWQLLSGHPQMKD